MPAAPAERQASTPQPQARDPREVGDDGTGIDVLEPVQAQDRDRRAERADRSDQSAATWSCPSRGCSIRTTPIIPQAIATRSRAVGRWPNAAHDIRMIQIGYVFVRVSTSATGSRVRA